MSKKRASVLFLVCGYIVFCLVKYFPDIKSEIISSLEMWAYVLIPSLFPYLVISVFVTSSGILKIFLPVTKIIAAIFNISEKSAEIYICSLFCGYPCGAVCSADLCRTGEISDSEAEKLICYTNNASPLFLVSVVGCSFIGSLTDGIALYVIQTLSAFLCAVLLRRTGTEHKIKPARMQNLHTNIAYCCENAVRIMINICGFVVLSAVCSEIIFISFKTVSDALSINMPKYIECALYSLFEISNGAKRITAYYNNKAWFAFLCAAVSWSGISVFLQIKSAAAKYIKTKNLIYAKSIQAFFSLCLGYFYKSMPQKITRFYNGNKMIEISLALSAIIFIIYIYKKIKQKA